MDAQRIFLKAQAFKIKSHRLSLGLRLKSVPEAKKFIREHSVVLWNAKAELPNLLDAIIGRIATGKERVHGKPAESCHHWREQLLNDPELLECRFFRKRSTVLHQDLWPYLTFFARRNRQRAEEDQILSKDARKIAAFLHREGPTRTDQLRKALKYNSVADGRLFHRGKEELQNLLIVLAREDRQAKSHTHAEIVDFWDECMPRAVRQRADQMSEKEARMKLFSATLFSSVLTKEKEMPRLFQWCNSDYVEDVDALIKNRDFVRVRNGNDYWIIPRKILGR
jgi:hypothetical protein